MLTEVLGSLGISPALLAERNLVLHQEAKVLVTAEMAPNGRLHVLTPAAAAAWQRMKAAAQAGGIDIHILSSFRSISRQAEIIAAKRKQGVSIEEVLRVLAPPGYSEHHTGRAVDISTGGIQVLQSEFERTTAFLWLCENAEKFGYAMSYPQGNASGYCYEPWHWCFHAI